MGKLNHGPSSRATGKAGAWVYQQYEGMQVFREYQPNVKNPQTDKQTMNRASFKLSSQLLSQFKNVIVERLAKVSIYTRQRRAIAINRIMSVISKSDPEVPTTLVSEVVNAINAASVSGLAAPAITTVSNEHSVIAADGDTVVMTTADYDADSQLIGLKTETYASTGTAKTVTPTTGFKSSVLMAVAYHALTEQGRATLDNLTFDHHTSEFGVYINRAIAAGDIEITNMGGNVIIAS